MIKVRQQGMSDCGVACLAMAAGISYEAAKAAFDSAGLAVRRGRKVAYSSNFRELIDALSVTGVNAKRKRFAGWGCIAGPSIVKTNVDAKGDWHWVVAYLDAEQGIVLLDPADDLPCFENPPLDVFYVPLHKYAPAGCYIELSVRE